MKVQKWRASEHTPSNSMRSEWVWLCLRLALIGLFYFAAARLGLLFVLRPEGLAGIWPASGVALAAILLSLRSKHPKIEYWTTLAVIFIVNMLSNMVVGNSLTISLGFAFANTLEPVIGAFVFLLVYHSGEGKNGRTAAPIIFEKIRQVLALVAAAAATLVTAFIGALVPTLGFGASYWDVWRVWWVEDSLGILLFTPTVLAFFVNKRIFQVRSTRWWIELALLTLGTGLVSWFSFGNNEINNLFALRPYMLFLFVFWAAMRFSLRVMCLELVLLAGIALGSTATGLGSFPLGGSTPGERLVFVQTYLFVASLTGFFLSTIFTERRKTVADLRYHSDLLDHISDAIISSDTNFVIRSWNQAAEEIYGWKAEEVIGKSIHEVLKTEYSVPADQVLQILFQTGFWKGEVCHHRKDGQIIQVLASVRVVNDTNDGSSTVVSTNRDISEHKHTLEALQASENRLRFALEGANDGLWDVDMRTNGVYMSPRGCEILGYRPDEMAEVAKVWNQLVHPEDLAETNQRLNDHISGISPIFEIEQRLRMKSGDWKWVHTRGKLVERGVDGQPVRMTGTHTDITERKQVTEALRERNYFIETILENAPIGFAVNRISDGQATFISSKFETLYGVPVGGIKSVDEYFEKVYLDPVFRKQMRERVMADIASGDPARMRWENVPLTTLTGEHRVVTSTNIPVIEQDLMISTVQDVTERWRAEELLRLQSTALNAAANAIMITNRDGVIEWVNPAFTTLTGYDPSEAIGKNPRDLVKSGRHDEGVYQELWNTVLAGKVWKGEMINRRKDGQIYSEEQTITPVCNAAGQVIQFIAIKQDITNRKLAEERLQNSQERYRLLVELSPDAIFVNRNERIDFVNPAALELFGASCPEQLLSKSPFDVFHPDVHAIISERIHRMVELHEPVSLLEEKILRVDGSTRDVEVAATPFTDSDGRAILVILRDITERKQAEKLLRETNEALEVAYDATLQGWSNALELRERETAGHSKRVVEKTRILAYAMGISHEEMDHIYHGALLHDIGKMGIPDAILLKAGPLNDEEWEVMRKHPVYAYNLLSKIPYLSRALDIPYYHHERWDGSGYPKGLAGEAIPLPARIFAVVDVWDALANDRPYRHAWDQKAIYEYLTAQAGKQFDPKVVNTFLGLV